MKNRWPLYLVAFLCLFSCKEKGLDTKLIASKYYKGVVKILLMDPGMEGKNAGDGYMGRGSGFIVTKDGYLFTNKHVVEMCVKGFIDYNYMEGDKEMTTISLYSEELLNDRTITKINRTGHTIPIVQVYDGPGESDYKLYIAEVVSIGSGTYDGAMLKIVGTLDWKPVKRKFSTVPLGNSDNVTQGENLCVYGYPAQFTGSADLMLKDLSTISLGIMSGYDFVINRDYGYLKTDAEIHPGNSGGPVFSEENKVIGIATAKGRSTGIGLLGGINGMYYISAIDSKAHTELVENGLTLPKRSASINSTKGTPHIIKTTKQAQAIVEKRLAAEKAAKIKVLEEYYKGAQLYFAINRNGYYEKFKKGSFGTTSINQGTGANRGKISVCVDHGYKALNTEKLIVAIDKLSTSDFKYYKYKDVVYSAKRTSPKLYFDFNFYDVGTYRVRVYSEDNALIGSTLLRMNPNR
ncbi:trypsin-like peptidase domain-containing protein [Rasiella rasia]|uniref:Trypsin-like peptidase domain-containing protein n=1 Tax=Rasiella rasia TaxID=2744027 RepID=A0A6G6GM81_9FLAO|nr:serine protease [Rasiella rasia]QIE59662.1 trypsin-like peptidase domain-containing protein [Rasiella rasia]